MYWPVLQANRFAQSDVTFVIRSERAGTASLMREVRQAIAAVYPQNASRAWDVSDG